MAIARGSPWVVPSFNNIQWPPTNIYKGLLYMLIRTGAKEGQIVATFKRVACRFRCIRSVNKDHWLSSWKMFDMAWTACSFTANQHRVVESLQLLVDLALLISWWLFQWFFEPLPLFLSAAHQNIYSMGWGSTPCRLSGWLDWHKMYTISLHIWQEQSKDHSIFLQKL